MIKIKTKKYIVIFAILLVFVLTSFVNAFTITTDEITETSIIWNLSQKTVSITEISLDGIIITDFSPNATRIVQSGLSAGESHIITVADSEDNISELEATTLIKPTSQGETLFTTINLWILVLLALLFVIFAVFTKIYFLAFIGTIFCFIGIIGSIGNSFLTGLIFVIMFIVTLIVGFNT